MIKIPFSYVALKLLDGSLCAAWVALLVVEAPTFDQRPWLFLANGVLLSTLAICSTIHFSNAWRLLTKRRPHG
jgi:hypothetical protein